MKKHRLLATALLTLLGTGLLAQQARALSYSQGDLFLTFYTTGTGSTFDYLVDIGQASTYRNATSPVTISLSGAIGLDLKSVFGADWKTRDDVYWGVFGGNYNTAVGSDPAYTLYAGNAETTLGTTASPFENNTSTGQASPAGKIKSIGTNFSQNDVATTNNAAGAIQTLPENNSFASFVTTNNGTTNVFNYFPNAMGNFGAGTSGTALDLFRMTTASSLATETPGTDLGRFTINDSGTVTFTPTSPVPEPSTYGLFIGGGAILLILARRHRKIQNA